MSNSNPPHSLTFALDYPPHPPKCTGWRVGVGGGGEMYNGQLFCTCKNLKVVINFLFTSSLPCNPQGSVEFLEFVEVRRSTAIHPQGSVEFLEFVEVRRSTAIQPQGSVEFQEFVEVRRSTAMQPQGSVEFVEFVDMSNTHVPPA